MNELTKEQIAEWFRDGEIETEKGRYNVKVFGFGATYSNAYVGLTTVFQKMNEGSTEDYSTSFFKAWNAAVENGMIATNGRKRNSVSRKSEAVYHFASMTPVPHKERAATPASSTEQFVMQEILK